MSEAAQIAILGSVVSIFIASGGWFLTLLLNRRKELQARQAKRIARLELEVRARIALEKAACEWLSELTGRPLNSSKLELRERTQKRSGLRPKLANADLPD